MPFTQKLVNVIVLSYGTVIGWLSPSLPTLLSSDTPLITGPITRLRWINHCQKSCLTDCFHVIEVSSYHGFVR